MLVVIPMHKTGVTVRWSRGEDGLIICNTFAGFTLS